MWELVGSLNPIASRSGYETEGQTNIACMTLLVFNERKMLFPLLLSPLLGEQEAETPLSLSCLTRTSPEQEQAGRFSPILLHFPPTPPWDWLPFCVSLPVLVLNAPLCSCSTAGGPPVTSCPPSLLRWRGFGESWKVLYQGKTFPPLTPQLCSLAVCPLALTKSNTCLPDVCTYRPAKLTAESPLAWRQIFSRGQHLMEFLAWKRLGGIIFLVSLPIGRMKLNWVLYMLKTFF